MLILVEIPLLSVTKISLKIACLKFYSNLPGANEFKKICWWGPWWVSVLILSQNKNPLRSEQNGCHFVNKIFKWIFSEEMFYNRTPVLLKFISNGPNDREMGGWTDRHRWWKYHDTDDDKTLSTLLVQGLTDWGRDKMATILQTRFFFFFHKSS